MTSLYDRVARTEDGSRRLASARLRHEVLKLIQRAHEASGLNQVQLAKKLGVRKSAVNQVLRGDGNVRINTLAEYLHATGFEMTVALVPAGEPREAVMRRRSWTAPAPAGHYIPLRSDREAAFASTAAVYVHTVRSTPSGPAWNGEVPTAGAHRTRLEALRYQPIATGI
jgi:transcriptional regulator with XRE-family HTH domain